MRSQEVSRTAEFMAVFRASEHARAPDSRAWNCVRAVNAALAYAVLRNARCTASEISVILPATFSRLPKLRDRRSIGAADPITGRLQH